MATIAFTDAEIYDNRRLTQWTGLTQTTSDVGEPLLLKYADFCVQMSGTFGVGGTIVLEGSNDGVSYFTLNDTQGSAVSITAGAIKQVVEAPRYVRPRISAGDGTTALNCFLFSRRDREYRF